MTEGTTKKRLSKVAVEFNISIARITEFLAKKGIQIESKPTAEVKPEVYDILVKEFQSEKNTKEASSKIKFDITKKESISINETKVFHEQEDNYSDDDQIDFIIKNKNLQPSIPDLKPKTPVKPEIIDKNKQLNIVKDIKDVPKSKTVDAPKPVVEISEKDKSKIDSDIKVDADTPKEISSIKVVGQVDLEKFNKKAKSVKKTTESKKDTEFSQTTEIKESDLIKNIAETVEPEASVNKELKQDSFKTKETIEVNESVENKDHPIKTNELDEVAESKVSKKTSKKSVHKDIEIKQDINSDTSTSTEKNISIDTTSVIVEQQINEKEHKLIDKDQPSKDKEIQEENIVDKHKIEESKLQDDENKLQDNNITPESIEIDSLVVEKTDIVDLIDDSIIPDNHLITQYKKLEGPVIVGKISLPVIKEKTPYKKPVSAEEAKRDKKKKRKRIDKKVKLFDSDKAPEKKPFQPNQQQTTPPPKFKEHKFKKEEKKPVTSDIDIEKKIKETLARLTATGKSKSSKYKKQKRELFSKSKEDNIQRIEEDKKFIKVTEFVTANELASLMSVQVNQVISTCMNLGLFVSINQRLDAETITIVADEFGFKVEFVSIDVQDNIAVEIDRPEDLVFRHPIVTVMGHVDHGKTSLLDYIRKTNVIAGEAGGITQHIGAYEVTLENNKKITFLDTPGHEAFTAMRARGAKVTDIAIIVVAADEDIMPQTIEAINHASAANVPIVFAINKIDKPNANIDKIKEGLAKLNYLVEDWGGKYQCQEVSAKKGLNIELLLEKVILEAELLDLKANPDKRALGTVIESSLDKGKGYVSKLLVLDGTIRVGDVLVAGYCFGKVKAMYNERNIVITEAGPSTPFLLLGLNGAPQAGDTFNVFKDEHEAKEIANKRLVLQREQSIRTQKHITLDEIGRRIAIGDFKELNIIVKGDVDGSVEALSDALLKLSNPQVLVNVIHKSVGQITESDILLASASNAVVIGFQVRPSSSARKLAAQEQIDVRLYSIIYNAINELKSAIEGMLSPDIEEKIVCNIEIKETFKITKVGTIAGCQVLDGKITKSTKIHLIRDGIVIYTGSLLSLKHFKDDAKEVKAGMECGISIKNYNDLKPGDIIEGFEEIEVQRKL